MTKEDFYDGALAYDCVDNEDDANLFIHDCMEPKEANLSKCFIAIFDPNVKNKQMLKEIIEAIKCSFMEDEEC